MTVVALCGGVGGAKLALGLYRVLEPGALSVIVNTADDFVHLGLHVSPDVDTVMYTLAGINNPETGWGRAEESWGFMSALAELGSETWFKLGDKDLATSVERTRRLQAGDGLTTVTRDLCSALGINARIVPMSDQPVRTVVDTVQGSMAFQDYFVRMRCQPVVSGLRLQGLSQASPVPEVLAALQHPDLRAVVICPSNPLISIDPILSVPGMRSALVATAAPVVAVAPVIAGAAVKGPTTKMMRELGLNASAAAVARHYGDILDGYVLDTADAGESEHLEVPCLATPVLMQDHLQRDRLATEVLGFCDRLRPDPLT